MQSKKFMHYKYIYTLAFALCNYFKLAAALQKSNFPPVAYDRTNSDTVSIGNCMTWDNVSQKAVFQRCPLSHKVTCPKYKTIAAIKIPTNTSGAELNDITCKIYNRQGTRCEHCRNGYGPAPFSDGFTCADCSKHRHLWILNLLFQLSMVTVMYLIVVLFQIKGTCSPLNVIITYSQLSVCAISVSAGVRVRVSCFLGPILTTAVLTIIGVTIYRGTNCGLYQN